MVHDAIASDRENSNVTESEDRLGPLLLATAEGCERSFALLYEHTHRRIFGIVLRVLRHRGEAEEVVQDIYVKVWTRSVQFDARRGMVVYWLAGIAQRAAIDAIRRASRRPSEVNDFEGGLDPYRELASSQPGPVELLEETERRHMVRAELQALPADQKESLMLAFVEGLSHHEIAARLACPLGTVKSRVRRSLISMRAPLQVLLWVPNRERDPNDCTVAAACDGFASALAIRSRRHMAGPSVEAAMHERKAGTLESGGSGKKGTSRKQAIAIGLSEAREEGGKVPSAIAARSSKPFARGNEGDPNRVGGTPERRTDGLPAALPRVR